MHRHGGGSSNIRRGGISFFVCVRTCPNKVQNAEHEPLSGVSVEIFDYQNQLIGVANTDDNGMVEIDITKKPFLLVAKTGEERGYLKLDDGNSLSLSMFNVSGQRLKKGVKGYIYGERGVWRPGDSLFLSFIDPAEGAPTLESKWQRRRCDALKRA